MVIVELLTEIFAESFLDMSSALVPGKVRSEKTKKAIKIIAMVIAMVSLICLIIGAALLFEESGNYKTAGIVFICIFAVYLAIVITANIIRSIKKHKLKQ